MRVAIVHDSADRHARGHAHDALAVAGVMDAVVAVEASCRKLGWEARRVAVGPGPSWPGDLLAAIHRAAPDVLFNLVESVAGDPALESAAATVLELSGAPTTGAPSLALALAADKPIAKALLLARGVPVARGVVLHRGDEPLDGLPSPWIVKPSREDASHGIDAGSVTSDEPAMRERARDLIERYHQPALVEEYLDGRELNVAVLGEGADAVVLPPAEIDFSGFPAGLPRIVTFDAKWRPESAECLGSPSGAAAPLAAGLAARIEAMALDAYRALGLRDYGRVDMRLLAERGPVVLEVNPNPDLSPDAGFALTGARAGLDHAEIIRRIVMGAARRARIVA